MGEQNKVELYKRDARFEQTRLSRLDRIMDLESCEILEPGEPLDLRASARILRKRLATVLIAFLLVFTVALIGTLKEKPVYQAQVLLEIQKENPDIPTIKDLYELESVSDSYLKTQYSILASESVARHVIDHQDRLRSRRYFQGRRDRAVLARHARCERQEQLDDGPGPSL